MWPVITHDFEPTEPQSLRVLDTKQPALEVGRVLEDGFVIRSVIAQVQCIRVLILIYDLSPRLHVFTFALNLKASVPLRILRRRRTTILGAERGAASKSGGVTHFCKSKHSYGTLLSTADTGITRTNVMKMYVYIYM